MAGPITQAAEPPPAPYYPELRAALIALWDTIPAGDVPRFYGALMQVRDAFEHRMQLDFIHGLIAQVYIGLGGEMDEENRPDLAQIQTDMLNLPQWNE